MSLALILILTPLVLVLLTLAVYGVVIYNRLVAVKNNVDRAWANIDVVLKQRSNEIPNLVKTVKAYAAHEKEVLQQITEARTRAEAAHGPGQAAAASADVSQALVKLFAVAEAYPDLKANQNYLELQKRLSGLEDLIADRREFYNESVVIYNTRIQELPDVFIARQLAWGPREYFKADEAARALPEVAL